MMRRGLGTVVGNLVVAKRRVRDYVLNHPKYGKDVVAIAVGERSRKGKGAGEAAVVVYVRKKRGLVFGRRNIKNDEFLAAMVGFEVDVKEAGEIVALEDSGRYRPVPIGVSVGNVAITAGSTGFMVENAQGITMLLSNNHVLADSNDAAIGSAIVQPGTYDGGRAPGDAIGTLERFVPIDFSGGANLVDAALAMLSQPMENRVQELNLEPGVQGVRPSIGQTLVKRGRTTGVTYGDVDAIAADVKVGYGDNKQALFSDQIIVKHNRGGPFSQGGDSGSAVFNLEMGGVGLLFAGSDTLTVVNHIDNVLALLDVELVVGEGGTVPPPPEEDDGELPPCLGDLPGLAGAVLRSMRP